MYNGIGLQTARGSGTNGHVQRNFAFVRPSKKDNIHYRNEDDIQKLEATNRQPNLEILDHERKRKIEVKVAELEAVLETQGFSEEDIQEKVDAYRSKLLGTSHSTSEQRTKGQERPILKETHEIAQAQQEKNARLREAFGISDYFVEGTSFDPERKARELAKSVEVHKKVQAEKEHDKVSRKNYALVRTPTPDAAVDRDEERSEKTGKRKTKKHNRDASSSPSRKKDKKKKSKKQKNEKSKKKKSRKRHESDSSDSSGSSDSSSSSSSSTEDSDSEADKSYRRKKSKRDKKKKLKKHRTLSNKDRENPKSDRTESKTRKHGTKERSVIRKSHAKDRRQRSHSNSPRRSRSRSIRKAEHKRDCSASPKHQRSRSRQKNYRSPTPKRSNQRKSPVSKNNDYSRNTKRAESSYRKRHESRDERSSDKKSKDDRKQLRTPNLQSTERKQERSVDHRHARTPSPLPIRRRSPSPKRRSPSPRRRSPSPRRRSPSPRRKSSSRDYDVSRNRRRSISRNRNKRRSSAAIRHSTRSRSPIPKKTRRKSRSPRNHRKSRSLSYSPARRNPEKYHEVLQGRNDKSKRTLPIVKLHATTSDREISTDDDNGVLPFDKSQEKEMERLKTLKSELAAKAKESLEKKICSENKSSSSIFPGETKIDRTSSSPQKTERESRRAREMKIVAQASAISSKEKQAEPFKVNENSPPIKDVGNVKEKVAKPMAQPEAGRKLRDRSRSTNRSRGNSSCSGSSESSKSSSVSSSATTRSGSSSDSSHSSIHSRPRSRGHSGSIPRRAGSPSFLDRRRITSARKRPIPYHRPGQGSASASSRSSASSCSLSP